ncbi:MAG TPA: hypothetical protein PLZ12_19570, partial [Saprospiraceae bacterium]|nr:hypothetical protein [Saprospiraceae bacterium]
KARFLTLKDAGFYDCYVPLRAAQIIKIIKISVGKNRYSPSQGLTGSYGLTSVRGSEGVTQQVSAGQSPLH